MLDIDQIQAYDYGYGDLGNKLVSVLQTWPVDFAAADRLLRMGVDLNAAGQDADENMLSDILLNFERAPSSNDEEQKNRSDERAHPDDTDEELGEVFIKIIRYFLSNGFDVHRQEDRYGAQCLFALPYVFCSAQLIDATKLLFDAGAKNVSIEEGDPDNTPWEAVGCECSFQNSCHHHRRLGNIYEAAYRLYQAAEEQRDYSKIDSYEKAVGKTINRVLSEEPAAGKAIFNMRFAKSAYLNCFNQRLFFVYDTGVLIATPYAEFWVDGSVPDVKVIDVSANFPGIVGAEIERITFDSREMQHARVCFEQPLTTIRMRNGHAVTFTDNRSEVDKKHFAAYFKLAP